MSATASARGRRNKAAGAKREIDVADVLEEDGWVVTVKRRRRGRQGFDQMANKAGETPLMIETKSTSKPFATFTPSDRAELLERAAQAGARPVLAWWPYDGGGRASLRWIYPDDWPGR